MTFVLLGIVVIAVVWAIGAYNGLVALKNRYGTLGESRLDFDGARATFHDRG